MHAHLNIYLYDAKMIDKTLNHLMHVVMFQSFFIKTCEGHVTKRSITASHFSQDAKVECELWVWNDVRVSKRITIFEFPDELA